MKFIMIAFIRLYQYTIGPMLGTCCRFYPSCSEYSILAFKKYGVFKGFYLTLKRLLKCHPWHSGGVDFP